MTRWLLALLPAHRFLTVRMSRNKENIIPSGSHLPEAELWSHSSSGTDGRQVSVPYMVWCNRRRERERYLSQPTRAGRLLTQPPWPTVQSVWFVTGPLSAQYLAHPPQCSWLFPGLFSTGSCLRSLCFWCSQLLHSQSSVLEVIIEASQAWYTSKDMLQHVRYLTLKISLSTASTFPLYCRSSVLSKQRAGALKPVQLWNPGQWLPFQSLCLLINTEKVTAYAWRLDERIKRGDMRNSKGLRKN